MDYESESSVSFILATNHRPDASDSCVLANIIQNAGMRVMLALRFQAIRSVPSQPGCNVHGVSVAARVWSS